MKEKKSISFTRSNSLFVAIIIFFIMLTGGIWYFLNYTNQIDQKKKIELAENRINTLNDIYINFLKAGKENRGYRLYQVKAEEDKYVVSKDTVLKLLEEYRLTSVGSQDSVLFTEMSQLILLRFEDLDAQFVNFKANPAYKRSKEEVEAMIKIVNQLEQKQQALAKYWSKQSHLASEEFDLQKDRNDQLFLLWIIATTVLAILFIVTYRKKIKSQFNQVVAEETLEVIRQKEQEFSASFDYASIGMALVSIEGAWLRVNKSLNRILGYTEEELLNLTFQDITYPDDLNADLQYIELMLRKEIDNYQMEKRYFTKEGALVWVLLSVSLVWENEKPKHFILQIQDITLRKKLQDQLRAEKLRLQQVIDGTNAGTWEWNVQTGETIFNEKWANLIGYTLAELEPIDINTWIKFAHPEDLVVSNQRLQDCFEKRVEVYECACRMKHKSGEWIWVMDRGKVMTWTTDGKPEWMFGSHIDITAMKRLQESLELERIKLETKNEELEGFAAIAAHDLKEPLRMISMFMERLSVKYESQLDEMAQKYIHLATDGAKRMSVLINDLLTYAEIGGVGEASFEKVDLNEVFEETVGLKASVIDEKNAIVSKTQLPIVWGHRTGMKLLFQNLIGNGLKYQAAGNQPIIKVGFLENESCYILSFADNGIGISEEHQAKVFNLFTRLHSKTEYEGTGMGLATCKKIVDLHGGSLWVESTLDKGSFFYLSILKQKQKQNFN